MINALSIDLEDWYHPELLKPKIKGLDKFSQVAESTMPMLNLLDKYNTKATFFVLGEVAEKNPDLIRAIYNKGHEIASHGMDHQVLWNLDAQSFARQLDDFENVITGILGRNVQIKGFRAPTFSLDNSTIWALKVLKERGYKYDSSLFPVRYKLYGVNGAPLKVYKPSFCDLTKEDSESEFLEFPIAVCNFCGLRIPIGGGFYFRLMPLLLSIKGLKEINRYRSFVFYLHPWESHVMTPRVKGISMTSYFGTYWGIHGVLRKLEHLLKSFYFKPVCEVLGV